MATPEGLTPLPTNSSSVARLLPNPVGDITEPLARIEKSIVKLGDQLEDVHKLPSVDEHLAEVNRGLASIVAALGEVHAELRAVNKQLAKQNARS